MTQFKVGDQVRVIDDGKTYCRYAEFIKVVAPEVFGSWVNDKMPSESNTYKIVAIHQHLNSCSFEQLAVIYDGKNAYVINVKGLELLPSPKSRVTLKPEYQEITATLKNGYVKLGRNLVIPAEYVDIVDEPYYSGTIVCGYCEDGKFTVHKAYEVKDGYFMSDDGKTGPFESVKQINGCYPGSSFFELIPAEVPTKQVVKGTHHPGCMGESTKNCQCLTCAKDHSYCCCNGTRYKPCYENNCPDYTPEVPNV